MRLPSTFDSAAQRWHKSNPKTCARSQQHKQFMSKVKTRETTECFVTFYVNTNAVETDRSTCDVCGVATAFVVVGTGAGRVDRSNPRSVDNFHAAKLPEGETVLVRVHRRP